MPHHLQDTNQAASADEAQYAARSGHTNSDVSQNTYVGGTRGLPQLPGHSCQTLSGAGLAQYHIHSDQTYGANSENQETSLNGSDTRRGLRQVQFPQDALLDQSYSLRSPTLGSAYSNRSPGHNCFPPDVNFETLKGNPTCHRIIEPMSNFPESNVGSEKSCLTTQNSSEGRMCDFTRSSSSTRPLKSSYANSQREAEAQLAWLGYKQELYRDWDFWTSFSLSFANIATVPGSFWAMYVGLPLGGPIVLVWGYLMMSLFMFVLNAVLAEMSSAYPVAGGMFSWTFKLARANTRFRDWARLLSWIVGCFLMICHVLVQIQISEQFIDVFLSLFTASGPHFQFTYFQRYAVVSAWLALLGLIGCTTTARSPTFWKIAGVVNVFATVSIFVSLLATAKHQRSFVSTFTAYENRSPFKSASWVFLYGSAVSGLTIGSEPAAHLSEETKDAAKTVPRVIFWSMVVSAVVGLLMNIVLVKTLAPVHHRTPGTLPVLDLVFWHCPERVAQFIVSCISIMMFFEDLSQTLVATRFYWALARDNAIPFAKYWRQVSTEYRIPRRATILLTLVSVVGATTCLEKAGILSQILIQGAAIVIAICYMVPIGLYLCSDKDAMRQDGRNTWTLRTWSRPLAAISLIFLASICVVFSTPSSSQINIHTWSWDPVVVVALVSFSMMTWMFYGQSHYAGPVKSLTVWTAGQEVELPNKVARVMVPAAAAVSRAPKQSVVTQDRTVPNQTTIAGVQTFNLPNAYVSYNSEGSMWCDTELENQQVSVI
ncbi:hypothetical protein CROQUDRAFT_666734 [Cronartium quercuum f. sp. fusiforme G11]|uniref:Amino acid transporter n=1 Tax=Cronartium quercuum f. sp. fusiforme G11 TaxID=708437 RepID=A0A9P6N5M2_9BASI|nr:hypothetical protein CROQUDRAFT_666734 [Cronartium quercuum f. sp. fusiforme G11]